MVQKFTRKIFSKPVSLKDAKPSNIDLQLPFLFYKLRSVTRQQLYMFGSTCVCAVHPATTISN